MRKSLNSTFSGLLTALVALCAVPASVVSAEAKDQPLAFLQFADPAFRDGLAQHNLLDNAGFRLHNTGFTKSPFGERWEDAPLLEKARASGAPYYIDRITGGMPYQSLDGIGSVAGQLKDDPNFLGFQAHEWGNSPTHDYHRIHRLILDEGNALSAESFAPFEGRTSTPYFSGGDYSVYHDLYRELKTQDDVEGFLTDYFKKLVAMTEGQLVSVTGHGQLHHTALRLGAKNVMAEIGNQVPLTAFQIACARGAAKQHGKPFGVYYEPWGGQPMGCLCATDFSPWWPDEPKLKAKMDNYNIGPQYGSGRSLQRRLLYYAWLSGAAWWSEEWGAENYFSNWTDYPLTEYGRIVQEFQRATQGMKRPEPIVPVALVLPPETFGVDIRYVAGVANTLWRIAPGDPLHDRLRGFAEAFLAPQHGGGGRDAHNLTPSPWIGCFDVFDADVSKRLLETYSSAVYFDHQQTPDHKDAVVFDDTPETVEAIKAAIFGRQRYEVDGMVGAAQAISGNRYLVGLFNNRGMKKTTEGETADPAESQDVLVRGDTSGMKSIVGETFVGAMEGGQVGLTIPAGELAILSFPANPEGR